MNCIQAQVLLAAHRELKNGEVDSIELDEHLEQCASCREVLAHYSVMGEQMRSMYTLKPPAERYTKLMEALAVEHVKFIQRSAVAPPPPPDFLKPYLQDQVRFSHKTDSFAAFSTAETGPLPILRTVPQKRRSSMGHFAAIGLAAVFLMTLMMGGITSLLLLANNHLGPASASIVRPAEVQSTTYPTHTLYQHVVSAVGDQTSIYYTAYGDGLNYGWMLEQLDRTTRVSTPLLATASSSPLIVLGSANNLLLWLQFDTLKTTAHRNLPNHTLHGLSRNWSLRSLSLLPHFQLRDSDIPNEPVTLLTGSFDQDVTPDWIHTPIQGIWFVQNTLLVAMIDDNGISHLLRYPLDSDSNFVATEIAKALPGHVFTSPTSNSDGTQIYWAEEWRTDDGNLHSNIWMQQVLDLSSPSRGPLLEHTRTIQQLFLQDGMSFHPAVVDETLFFLSTANGANTAQATPGTTPIATQSGAIASGTAPNNTIPTVSWADTGINTAPLDNNVRGTLLMLPLDGDIYASPMAISAEGSVSSLQAGTDFVLWQSDDGYGMYSVPAKTDITVGSVLDGARFVAVNGDTTVWTANNPGDTAANNAGPLTTLEAFIWPMK